jgi:hypothetical protein
VRDQPDARRLLSDAALAESAVVANCAMNRERGLAGVNSYARELGFNPVDVLAAAVAGSNHDAAAAGPGNCARRRWPGPPSSSASIWSTPSPARMSRCRAWN